MTASYQQCTRECAAKYIQNKYKTSKDRYVENFKLGYKSISYNETYDKLYKNPIFNLNYKGTMKSKGFIDGYNDKLNEVTNDVYNDLEIPQCIFPKQKRVVSIGDIHGDWRALVYCLSAAKVIDENTGKWIGKDTYVVQLGDCTDRYRAISDGDTGNLLTLSNEKSEKRILDYLWDLDNKQGNKKDV